MANRFSGKFKRKQKRDQLKYRLRFQSRKLTGKWVSYRHGNAVLAWWCRQHWIRVLFYQQQEQLIREAIRATGCATDEADVVQHSLTSNVYRFWRLAALARCHEAEYQHWVRVEGWENIEAAEQAGKGVIIINTHTTLSALNMLVLTRSGRSLETVGDDRMYLELLSIEDDRPPVITDPSLSYQQLFLSLLQHAKRVLANGGIVQLFADGYRGSGGVSIDLFGRERVLRTGFAELADLTGAAVVPVVCSMSTDGSVLVRFCPPLRAADASDPREQRVEMLLRQYGELLRSIWTERLQDITWSHLRKFLKKPPRATLQT